MDPLTEFKNQSQKVIDNLKEDLKSIRTGRATPSLVENLIVETYGGQTKLRLLELATITTDGPSALSISPFDPSVLSDIEKAILKSPLGISPAIQGNKITLHIPALSEEQREKFIKFASQKVEERKVMIRNLRDNARKTLKTAFEKKEVSEDSKFRQEKEIDIASQKCMEEIDLHKNHKEEEIREV
ncbi:ribosome recycling factor [Candidatus Roizmanbacteria bacterium]|nr:ribosome recycling factor [Candidatus Roizmanbacteria bacterium]